MDKWLNNPTAAKIIALLLAISLWWNVNIGNKEVGTSNASASGTKPIEDVKIKVIGLDESKYVLKYLDPYVVDLVLRGKKSNLAVVMPEECKVILDLKNATGGKQTFKLLYEFPPEIQLQSMTPSTVTVDLEELKTKQYDIEIQVKGTPANGYKAGEPILPSTRVHVTLPKSALEEVHSVKGYIDVSGRDSTLKQQRVKLTALDSHNNEVPKAVLTPATVEVEIPITKPFKSVPIQANYTGALPPGLAVKSVTFKSNQVTLYGAWHVLDSIEYYDDIVINLDKIRKSQTLSLPLRLPANVDQMEPSKLEFEIEIAAAVQKNFKEVPILIKGENELLKVRMKDPASQRVNIAVEGYAGIIKDLRKEDVQIIANVADLPAGTHRVVLKVILSNSFVRLIYSSIEQATVVIEEKNKKKSAKSNQIKQN